MLMEVVCIGPTRLEWTHSNGWVEQAMQVVEGWYDCRWALLAWQPGQVEEWGRGLSAKMMPLSGESSLEVFTAFKASQLRWPIHSCHTLAGIGVDEMELSWLGEVGGLSHHTGTIQSLPLNNQQVQHFPLQEWFGGFWFVVQTLCHWRWRGRGNIAWYQERIGHSWKSIGNKKT